MKKITFLLTFLLGMVVFPTNVWSQYPPTAPDGFDLVEDPSTLQAGDIIIIRQGSGNKYLKINNTQTTDASAATAFVLEDTGTGAAGDFYLKAEGTENYLKAAAANGVLAPTANVSEAGVYNIKIASASGSSPETTIGFANFAGEDQNHVIRLITGPSSSRVWYNSNGWKFNTGGGHWTGFYAFKKQVIIPGQTTEYNVKVSGINDATAGVVFDGTTYHDGDVITVTDVIEETDLTAVDINGYVAVVSISGTKISITYTETRFIVDLANLYVNNTSVATTTDPIVEGQWYILSQVRDGESPAYDNGAGNNIKRAATSVTANTLLVTNTPANDIKKYLIRFFSTGEGNGYLIQSGIGNFWYGTGTGNGQNLYTNASNSTAFLVYNATNTNPGYAGWAINETTDGTSYGRKVDNNSPGNNISFWGSGQTEEGTNNVWKLYPVELGAMLADVNLDVVVTDGTNSKTFSGVTFLENTTITAADVLTISSEYITSDSHTVTTADEGQTVTLNVSANSDMPITDGAHYAWQTAVGNGPSYIHVNDTGAVVNPKNHSIDLTKPVAANYAWQIEGDIFNGFSLKNDKTSQYLGGRTASGGAMAMEDASSLFAPVYNNATTFKWKNTEYGYWIDRSDGAPYAHTAGNNNSLKQLYPVTIQLSDAQAGNVVIGGDTISDFTQTYYLAEDAAIALETADFSILDYNGSATVAEALAALGAAGGTLTINVTQEMSNITINVVKGNQTVKTVTVENVAAGRTVNVAETIGDVLYVTGYEPATITGTADDQTVNVTYTSSLPFTLADDPTSSDAPAYALTLRQKYAHGNVATSTSQYDVTDEYLWTFGGDEFNGITVYNKGNGYMSVQNEGDSRATFGTEPVVFSISPNTQQTNGFNLYLPNTTAYINENGSKGYVSTWVSSAAATDAGSCLVVIPEATAVANVINKLEDYFHTTDYVGALASADTAALRVDYEALKANPSKADYLTFKAELEANLIPLTPGAYYIIQSAYPNYYAQQQKNKVWYYSASSSAVKWRDLDAYPDYQVFQVVDNGNGGNVLYNPMAGVYLTATNGSVSTDISAAKTLTLTALGGGQQNIYLDGTADPIHTEGHNNGAGTNGSLTNWPGGAGSCSSWYIIPQVIEEITLLTTSGVTEGEEIVQSFAHGEDVQMPLAVGVYTISEETGTGAHLDTIASGVIKANTGYIISGPSGKVVPLLPVNPSNVTDVTGNMLVPGTGVQVSGYMLAYKKGDSEAKFWKISNLTVPTNRAYLPEGTPTRGLEFLFGGLGDDVTGINGITTGAENGAIYDLQGRRVNNAQKGVYIINGKKVIK